MLTHSQQPNQPTSAKPTTPFFKPEPTIKPLVPVQETTTERVPEAIMRLPIPSVQRKLTTPLSDKNTTPTPFFRPLSMPIQAKLTVGQPNDKYEQEADAVADKVVQRFAIPNALLAMPKITPFNANGLQTKCATCEKEEHAPIQRKGNGEMTASPHIESRLSATKGGGSSLPASTRMHMESAIGADFSNVRVHTGGDAVQLSQDLNAHAFTHGADVYFNSGKFSPNTEGGQRLLAHELTHTVQQNAGIRRKEAAVTSVCPQPEIEVKEAKGPEAQTDIPQIKEPVKSTAKASKGNVPTAKSATSDEAVGIGGQKTDKKAPTKEPSADPAFQNLVTDTKHAKKSQQQNDGSETKVKEAELSAETPETKDAQISDANKILATEEQLANEVFDKGKFKENIKNSVNEDLPQNKNDNSSFQKGGLDALKAKGTQGLKSAQNPSKAILTNTENNQSSSTEGNMVYNKTVVNPIIVEKPGRKASIGQSERVVPKPLPNEEVVLDKEHDADSLDKAMEDDNLKQFNTKLTNKQLENSNESDFTKTLSTKQKAQEDLCQIPAKERDAELNAHQTESKEAQGQINKTLGGKFADRKGKFGEVDAGKETTKQKNEQLLADYYTKIASIYSIAKIDVDKKLETLDGDVSNIFGEAMTKANDTFKANVQERLDDYYGVGVWNLSEENEDMMQRMQNAPIKQKIALLTGMLNGLAPESADYKQIKKAIKQLESQKSEEIPDRIFREEKTTFLNTLDTALDEIGNIIERTLNEAKAIIVKGKADIKTASEKLPADVKKEAAERTTDFTEKFNDLNSAVNEKQKDIETRLAKEYKSNVKKLQETFEKIRVESAMPWWEVALRAIKAVAMTVYNLGKLLLNVLIKAVSVIGDIVAHPIRFIGNLISAIGKGFGDFSRNIGTHLENIIFKLLLGTIPPNIKIPTNFDEKGLLSFGLDILGLSKDNIRAQAVDKLTEPVVAVLEDKFELFILFKKEGFAGLWAHIKDKIGDIKAQVIEQIKSYFKDSIIGAAIKFLLSALTPASGFIKACETLINVAMFFIKNLENLLKLLDSILDSFIDIAKGNIANAAKKVETALADILLIGLKFLAALIGVNLDKISAKVQQLFNAIRNPVNRAIQWLLGKAMAFAEKSGLVALAKKGKEKFEQGKQAVVAMGQKAVGAIVGWWQNRIPIKTPEGEEHHLSFENGNETGDLMVESTPVKYRDFLKTLEANKKKAKKDGEDADEQAERVKGREKAEKIVDEIILLRQTRSTEPQNDEKIRKELIKLAKVTAPLLSTRHGVEQSSVPVYGGLNDGGFGTKVTVETLTKEIPLKGSASTSTFFNDAYRILNKRKKSDGSHFYIRGHLLNNYMGGPGTTWANLTPLKWSVNNPKMLHEIENPIWFAINDPENKKFRVVIEATGAHTKSSKLIKEVDSLKVSQKRKDNIKEILETEKYVPTKIKAVAKDLDTNKNFLNHTIDCEIDNDSINNYYASND